MPRRKQAKVYITEVNTRRKPPLARAREVVSGATLTISLDINSGKTPNVGEIWWVQNLGTRWALYALVSDSPTNTSGIDNVSSTTVDLFFQVKEKAINLSYYPVVKFDAAKVADDPANVSHYIISWTKCTKSGGVIRNEKAQQYTWNPNENTDGTDAFVDVTSGENYDYSVEIPFEVDNPKKSYYKARIRAVSKANATKGAWSPWTKPKIPIRNSLNGPPLVQDVQLDFEAKEMAGGRLDYRAIVRFKDVGYWDVPGYDFEDDVDGYDVQLQPLEKIVRTYGTLANDLSKAESDWFIVKETELNSLPGGLPTNLTVPFDVLIGNEIIGISKRTGTQANRKYYIEKRGKYSTIAVGHGDGIAVKEYDLYAYDTLANLVPVDPEDMPILRETITNKDQDGNVTIDVKDKDQDDTIHSWPRVSKLNTKINAAQTSFNTTVTNAKLLKNLPKTLSAFSPTSYLFKVAIKKEVLGVTDWNYNFTTKVLHLEVERGIDSTHADDYDQNVKVRLNSWLAVGYLQEDMSEESDTITVVEDRILDFDLNDDGIDEDFTIRVNDEKLQVYSRRLVDSFQDQTSNKNYYVYEYEVYRAIQNTEISSHTGGTDSIVEIDLGYYYAATFETIPKPTRLYWRARVRAHDKFNRFGAWSDWTDPLKASEDADILAPAPTGVVLNFNRKHRNRGWSVNAQVSWDKVKYEIPGGNTVDDVKGYQPRLLASDGSKLAEPIGNDIHTVISRYLTDNLAYLILDPTNLTEYSFSAGQLINVNLSTVNRADIDEIYNGSHRVLEYNFADATIIFYKSVEDNFDLEETTGTVTTAQTIIRVYEPDKTNSTQRQLGTAGTGYIFLTSYNLPDGVVLADATNASYYEMMYVKDSWKSLTDDYYEYFVVRGVMGTTPRNFATQWMIEDVTEPIKPMLVFTYPAAFEATKLVDSNAQELEPAGGARISQVFGPVRRQYWYVSQVRTLDSYNRVGAWSKPSSPATASDNVRPPQPYNINVIPYTNYVKVDWDIQAEPGVFAPALDLDGNGELNPDDFEIISSDVSYFKVQLWSEDPHAEAPLEQEAFGLNGNPAYASGVVTLTTDQTHTFTVGETVIIRGCWPNLINGEHVVKSVPSSSSFTIQVDLSSYNKTPYQIDGIVYKKGEKQALDLYKQYPIHFFRRNSMTDLTKLQLAEKGDICQIINSGDNNGYYELINPNYRLLSNWKKIKKQNVQIPGLLFYDRYVNLTSRNVPVKKLTNKVWARICSVDEAGNQSEWIAAGPFNTEFIPGPEWVLTRLIHKDTAKLDAKVQWAEVTSPDFTVGSYNIELQGGRLYAQIYGDSMDFWGLDPTQDIVVGMLSNEITASTTDVTLNVTEFGESADVNEFIKIGDELFKITHREASDDINGFIDAVYTVQRAAVGTTAASHPTGALILKVQSEAIIVRELFTPAATADINTNQTYDIVIGNERMKVLDRVGYSSSTYGPTYGSTSPTYDPTGSWTSAGATGIGTIGSGSTTQTGSSALMFTTITTTTGTTKLWIAATSTGIWTSPNLTTWTQRNNTTNLRSVAYGDGLWVAVGDSGKILTATDPTTTWKLAALSSFGISNIYGIKYANGIWAIVGENNKIAVTYNPTSTWTLIDPNLDVSVDVLNKTYNSSTKIVTLTIPRNLNIIVGNEINVLGLGSPFDGKVTVTAVNNTATVSTIDSNSVTGTLNVTKISYEAQKFVTNNIYTKALNVVSTFASSLLKTKNNQKLYTKLLEVQSTFNSILKRNTYAQLLAAAPKFNVLLARSNNLNKIFDQPLSAAVSSIPEINLSIPEKTSIPSPSVAVGLIQYPVKINSISYGAGYWAVACDQGIIGTASNPFGTWTKRTTPTTNQLNAINYASGYWVAVGNNGTILTTVNPTTAWTLKPVSGVTTHLFDVSYGAGTWVIGGASGKVLTASTPTTTWTVNTNNSGTIASSNIFSVAFGLGSTTSEWVVAGANGSMFYAGAPANDSITGNIWVYLVLRDRTWGSNLGQVEDFQHPDLTPIFDTITDKSATRDGAAQADRDNNDYWNYTFIDVAPILYYRSRVQGVLKSGVKGNWSHYTLWANPNDLTAPPTPLVDADFDAKVLNINWIMPNDVTNQVFKVDNFDEILELSTAKIGDIAVYTTVNGEITTVFAYRLTALPADVAGNWQPTLSPIDDQGNTIDVANDYLYKTDAAAFYQVQVSRIPKKWEAVGALGRTLENINDGTGAWTFKVDPGQKLDKYPKVGERIKVGPGPTIKVATLKNGLNEVQQISILRDATGNFKLTFRGATTGNISSSASAGTVQSALIALSTIPSGGVSVSKPKTGVWNVKFTGSLATQTNIPQIVPDGSGLNPAYGGNEIMTLTSCPTTAEAWQAPQITLGVNRTSPNFFHSKGAVVQWVQQSADADFYDPKKPFRYRWLWKDDRFVTEMSRSYTADHLKDYLYVVRVRAADAAGNFSNWETEFVSPTGVPTPDVTNLEFADIDNTPDTLEGILTFIGSMDITENINEFVTELMPAQQIRTLNDLTASATKIFVKRKKKVLNPASVGPYMAFLEDEKVWVTARTEVIYQGIQAYRLTVQRGYGDSATAVAHDKNIWFQWFHHFSVKQIVDGTPYTPSLDATVDADSGTIISTVPAIGEYKTIFHGIKSGRWYMGRAKAVTDDGKSGSWSDWSDALRGEPGASLTEGSVPAPNPVRNLILDVDEHKVNVSWLAPKDIESTEETDSIEIDSISRSGTTASVITKTPHGFSMGDTDTPPDTVQISGAFDPFNGVFQIAGISDETTFTITVDVKDEAIDPTLYPIEGQAATAVVTRTSTSSHDNTDIDHYMLWFAKGVYNGTTLVTTIAKLNSGEQDFPKPFAYKNPDISGEQTSITFPLKQSPGNYMYFVKIIAVNGAGKKSEPRYARGDVSHPPTPQIGEIKVSSYKQTRKCKVKFQILVPPPVADLRALHHFDVQWFKSKSSSPNFDNVQIRPLHPSKLFANHPTKRVSITGTGGLRRGIYVFIRIRAVNKNGNHSQWTAWKRKKIVTAQ